MFSIRETKHGPMLVDDNDYWTYSNGTIGVGHQLINNGIYEPDEVTIIREHARGVAIDAGANIGVLTLELSRVCDMVIAFEPQQPIYYALCGNIILNNRLNVKAIHAAVSDKSGVIDVPLLDYTKPASFGSLELKSSHEFCGQNPIGTGRVASVAIDDLGLTKLDFMKVDVEGMELDVLNGAEKTILRCRPIILAEHVKCGDGRLRGWLTKRDYKIETHQLNFLAVPS